MSCKLMFLTLRYSSDAPRGVHRNVFWIGISPTISTALLKRRNVATIFSVDLSARQK